MIQSNYEGDVTEVHEPNLKSTKSNLLIHSQRSKIEEYNHASSSNDARKNGEYNPYEKIMENQDSKDLKEEKSKTRSPINTGRDSIPTSQAESYQDTHVVMTNSSMAKLKKKLGSIVADRQY